VAKEKVPAFQFYPKDFLADSKVVRMSNTEVGIYIRLLCHCWLDGDLPLETEALASMAHMPIKQFTKLWENSIVKTCFHVGPDGRLHQGRLDSEREKQEQFRRRQTDAAASRWHMPKASHADAAALPDAAPPAIPPQCSPISDLRSSSPVSLARERARDAEPDVGDRARDLLEAYPRWYAEERHNARLPLLGGPLQYAEAVKLCETWDDARLEKLARLVLSTNDEFIAKTDRGWKIFVMKSSWADNLLREWELKNGAVAV
jgi:uncharacterized protein YdaU (DUF1376 family)